jgi:ubiquinone/menaquinone biosynthesis C-methylase UbiE
MKITNDWRSFVKNNLTGRGLEIGALHHPFDVNSNTTMVYQDRLSSEVLKEQVGKSHKGIIDPIKIVSDSVVSDATVVPYPDNSFDFVVNCHVFEHLVNPISALHEWLRVVKPSGYVFMVVPDMRYTFDKPRKLTPVLHIIEDYFLDITEVELEHYKDFCGAVQKVGQDDIEKNYKEQANIHVHTFTDETLKELLAYYEKGLNYKIVEYVRYDMHICILLKKEGSK